MGSGPARFFTLPLAIATAAAFVAGCSDDDDETLPDVDGLDVVEIQELDLPFGDAYLAPNGERIATYADNELCIHSADGEQERCVAQDVSLDANSIRWSSDGTRLVYTEDLYKRFLESDIWLLDAESGDLTNLTDDGVAADDGNAILNPADEEGAGADLDAVPVWVDDDSAIRFLRWNRGEEDSTVEVLEMPSDGGDPESIGTLATETAPVDVAYSADGGLAAYNRADDEDTALTDLEGESAESIADDAAHLVSFSSDGEDLLVAPNAGYNYPDMPPVKVVSVDGDETTELDGTVGWATWRTGGDGLAYATYDLKDPERIALRLAADAGGDGREVDDGGLIAPYREATWRPPVWSSQDTILLMRQQDRPDETESEDTEDDGASPFQYVLVHLGEE